MSSPSGHAGHCFGWPIYSDASVSYTPTFSGGSWVAALPLTNLGDRRLSRVARSSDALVTSTTFEVDLGVARTVGVLAIPKHTMSSAATIQWRGSSSAGVFSGGPLLYDTGAVNVWPAGVTDESTYGMNLPCAHFMGTPLAARYWRCDIVDTGNTAGYIDLARVVIAAAWYPSNGISVGASMKLQTDTTRQVTDGGAALYVRRAMRRSWDVKMEWMLDPEAFDNAQRLMRIAGLDGQLFFAVQCDSPTYLHERAMLCVMQELGALEYSAPLHKSAAFRLVEEL